MKKPALGVCHSFARTSGTTAIVIARTLCAKLFDSDAVITSRKDGKEKRLTVFDQQEKPMHDCEDQLQHEELEQNFGLQYN